MVRGRDLLIPAIRFRRTRQEVVIFVIATALTVLGAAAAAATAVREAPRFARWYYRAIHA
jgi:hypothetical protein